MIYKILCDDKTIYDSRDDENLIVNPVVELEVNKAGSLSFTILPGNELNDSIKRMKSTIVVSRDDEIIFTGRAVEIEDDFQKRRSVYCEGALAFFNDSVQPFAEFHGITVRGYLEKLVEVHNSQVEAGRRFTVGIVTARDANDSLYRFTNYNPTITEIKEDLLDDLGGYLFVRNEGGKLYLDYLEDYLEVSDQKIEFGENLLDFTRGFNTTDLATRIIPLGAVIEDESTDTIQKRITVESVNGGKNYIESAEAIKSFGIITKTVTWDDVTTAKALLTKGKKYLQESQFDNMTIECKAVDLHYADDKIPAFTVGQYVWVISGPHGLKKRFPVNNLTLSLDNVADNTITLGRTELNRTFTEASKEANEEILKRIESIPDSNTVLAQAGRNATNLIKKATHGHVVVEPNEILVMDTNDKTTAKRIWRLNQGGIGFSKDGYEGDFPVAMTQDGAIVADFITAGKMNAEVIKAGVLSDEKGKNYWNMKTGEFSLQTGMIGDTAVENISDSIDDACSTAKSANKTANEAKNAIEEVKNYADKAAETAVANQTQSSIFNKLTNNGKTQGIYMKDGKLYLNAEYIASGILKSRDGETFYLDLDKGVLNMKATSLAVTGTSLTNIWKNTGSFNSISTEWLTFVSWERGIWMGDCHDSDTGDVVQLDISSDQPDGVPVTNSLLIKPWSRWTQCVGQAIPVDSGKYFISFYHRARLNPNLLRNTADGKIVSSFSDDGWLLTSGGNGVGSVVKGFNNLGTDDRTELPYPLAYTIKGNTSGNRDFAQRVYLKKGRTYVLTWYSRLIDGTTSATLLVRNWNTSNGACELTLFNSKVTNTFWRRECVKFTATSEDSEITSLQFGVSGSGNVQYACMKLEEADYSTLYVPNVSDAAYNESDKLYYDVFYRWGNGSTYGYYSVVNSTIAEIKSGKWNRFTDTWEFTKGEENNSKLDIKNTDYFKEYETGKYKTKMRVGIDYGNAVEFCGMMISRLSDKDTLKSAEASVRWAPNGSDSMLKDSIVSTLTGSMASDINQGLYINSSGQLCLNATMIKSGTISADMVKTGTLNSIAINNNGNFKVDKDGKVTIKAGCLRIEDGNDSHKYIQFDIRDGNLHISLVSGNKEMLITPGQIFYIDRKGIYRELTNQGV